MNPDISLTHFTMKLTISGTPSEVELMIRRMSFKNNPATDPINPEIKEERDKVVISYTDPVIEKNIFEDTFTVDPEIISEVKGKVFKRGNDSKIVDILFDNGIFYKRFVSAAAAGSYFGKANLSENIRKGSKFRYNDIWFTIQYSKPYVGK